MLYKYSNLLTYSSGGWMLTEWLREHDVIRIQIRSPRMQFLQVPVVVWQATSVQPSHQQLSSHRWWWCYQTVCHWTPTTAQNPRHSYKPHNNNMKWHWQYSSMIQSHKLHLELFCIIIFCAVPVKRNFCELTDDDVFVKNVGLCTVVLSDSDGDHNAV